MVVAAPDTVQKRLTIQVEAVADDTTTIRSLDWDRDRFDIEFGLQNGTTYNSFIVRGEKVALVDTSHAKFRDLYLQTLIGEIDPTTIDYLVISHTEPDHSGLVRDVLELAPQAVVVGAKVAIAFLKIWSTAPLSA
jgi:flavorubredoxin